MTVVSCFATDCSSLGLTGLCCPATDGTMLGCCGVPPISDEWLSYIYNIHAVIDRDAAWQEIQTLNNFGIGGSMTNSLFWAASRAAPPVGMNATVHSPNFVVDPTCSSNSACEIQGILI
jgi:hypothetical protein